MSVSKSVFKVLKSETTPFTALVNVASLELILREKLDALKNRKVARDVFDYWYINQFLRKEVKPDFSGHDKSGVLAELHRLLPKSHWGIIDIWLE